MLRKSGVQALKALLELAQAPGPWRSTQELAEAQQLPAAMVEQLLLRLRRAGLVESRRGRHGGYRLAKPARQIVLTEVLAAAAAAPAPASTPAPAPGLAGLHEGDNQPSDQVTAALEKRLERSITQVLCQLTLEDLLFDLRSAAASLDDDGGLMLG